MFSNSDQPSTTGTLKTTISLGGKNPTISGPFYLMKDFNPSKFLIFLEIM